MLRPKSSFLEAGRFLFLHARPILFVADFGAPRSRYAFPNLLSWFAVPGVRGRARRRWALGAGERWA